MGKSRNAGDVLSSSYKEVIQFFIDNKFVYESAWTAYNNPKEYTLCKSLKNFLWGGISCYREEIEHIKLQSL